MNKKTPNTSPGAVMNNLTYWSERGYLTRTGSDKPLEATYTVANKEFFA